MQWTITDGKITADGKAQDFATYLWTLRLAGDNASIERKLILQAKRLPALKRLGFGKAAEQGLIDARRAIGQPEVIALVQERQPCVIPAQYRKEIGTELRKGGASHLADFLGL